MLQLSVGTEYVKNPSALIDEMGHAQWQEWKAYNQICPLTHPHRMLGLVAHLLAGFFGVGHMPETHPWQDSEPQKPVNPDEATQQVVSMIPGAVCRQLGQNEEILL